METENDIRYARQIILDDIGEDGQNKLINARVLVIGAGGLGSPVLFYLAAAGIGHLGIVDHDKVSLCNLQRQILFKEADVNRLKVTAAAETIFDLNSSTKVTCYNHKLTADNATNLFIKYDYIVDCTDNYQTRVLINKTCFDLHKPLISAAVERFEGQLYVFTPYKGNDYPCYQCLYPDVVEHVPEHGRCAEVGIVGAVAGIIGAWQATEIIKIITEIGAPLSQHMLTITPLTHRIKKIRIEPDKECPCCGTSDKSNH